MKNKFKTYFFTILFLTNLNFIKVNENKTTLISGYNVSQKDILFKKITNE